MTKRLAAFLALALVVTPVARAQNVDLRVAPTPITFMAGQTSPGVDVQVFQTTNDPSNFFVGWQIALTVQPIAGATGTVTFSNPPPPTPPGTFVNVPRPPNYVFGTTPGSSGGITAVNSGTDLSAADFSTSGGYNVPQSGRNLLTVNFTSTGDASGQFGIFARRGMATQTNWTQDLGGGIFGERTYGNVPDGLPTQLVQLGTINVTPIPEPMTCTAVLLGGLGVAGAVRRYRRGQAAPVAA